MAAYVTEETMLRDAAAAPLPRVTGGGWGPSATSVPGTEPRSGPGTPARGRGLRGGSRSGPGTPDPHHRNKEGGRARKGARIGDLLSEHGTPHRQGQSEMFLDRLLGGGDPLDVIDEQDFDELMHEASSGSDDDHDGDLVASPSFARVQRGPGHGRGKRRINFDAGARGSGRGWDDDGDGRGGGVDGDGFVTPQKGSSRGRLTRSRRDMRQDDLDALGIGEIEEPIIDLFDAEEEQGEYAAFLAGLGKSTPSVLMTPGTDAEDEDDPDFIADLLLWRAPHFL